MTSKQIIRSLRRRAGKVVPVTEELKPFPRVFPEVVLRRVFDYLPWHDRIMLERTCRLWYRLLRPLHCSLPLDRRVRITVQPYFDGDKDKGDHTAVALRYCWGETLATVTLKCNENDQLTEDTHRILRQLPTSHIEMTRQPRLEKQFFDCVADRTNRIEKIWISFSSIQDMNFSRDYWRSFWNKMPNIKSVEIYTLKTDSSCSLDDMLLDLVSLRPLQRLVVSYCTPSITDATLLALSKNCVKLTNIECIGASNVTCKGVSALAEQLVLADVPNGVRRRLNFWRCDVKIKEFWMQFYELMDPVTWNNEGKLIVADPTLHRIEDFANDRLFVSFD